jgi:hypothetical protein
MRFVIRRLSGGGFFAGFTGSCPSWAGEECAEEFSSADEAWGVAGRVVGMVTLGYQMEDFEVTPWPRKKDEEKA